MDCRRRRGRAGARGLLVDFCYYPAQGPGLVEPGHGCGFARPGLCRHADLDGQTGGEDVEKAGRRSDDEADGAAPPRYQAPPRQMGHPRLLPTSHAPSHGLSGRGSR